MRLSRTENGRTNGWANNSDIGFMTGGSGISVLTELRGYIDGNRTDFVSRIEKKIKSYNKSLEKIKTTYLEEQD